MDNNDMYKFNQDKTPLDPSGFKEEMLRFINKTQLQLSASKTNPAALSPTTLSIVSRNDVQTSKGLYGPPQKQATTLPNFTYLDKEEIEKLLNEFLEKLKELLDELKKDLLDAFEIVLKEIRDQLTKIFERLDEIEDKLDDLRTLLDELKETVRQLEIQVKSIFASIKIIETTLEEHDNRIYELEVWRDLIEDFLQRYEEVRVSFCEDNYEKTGYILFREEL